MTTPSKQELGADDTPETPLPWIQENGYYFLARIPGAGGELRQVAKFTHHRDATFVFNAIADRATLLSRVSQLESDCRMKDEALRAIARGYGPDHLSRFCSDIARKALGESTLALSPAPQPGADAEPMTRNEVDRLATDRPNSQFDSGDRGQASSQPDAVQADETAWLIEFSEKVSRTPAYYGHTGEGLGETTDNLKAVRFARREDAQAIIDDIGWNEASPVEHMWSDGKARPASPPPADGGRNG